MQRIEWVGWDIGGAHVKASALNESGHVVACIQQPCPLWQGMEFLQNTVNSILKAFDLSSGCYHAVTMTGELVDLFPNRNEGVRIIIDAVSELLSRDRILVYAGRSGFLSVDQITDKDYTSIASANWLAMAHYVAQQGVNGIVIDIGSTTTDLIPISNGLVLAQGYSDYERLKYGELVYSGIVRTAVMAIAHEVRFKDSDIGLMAEYFATMADVYRLTGDLNEVCDQFDTADGAGKSVIESSRRLARMIGCDYEDAKLVEWKSFANELKEKQIERIKKHIESLVVRHKLSEHDFMVSAGVGKFLVKELAARMGFQHIEFDRFIETAEDEFGMAGSDCAPAVAVALLAYSCSLP